MFAMKEIRHTSRTDSVPTEAEVLKALSHPNIIRFYSGGFREDEMITFLILELCSGGDLKQVISNHKEGKTQVPEEYIWQVVRQTALALEYCHCRDRGWAVLHRDVKPANILVFEKSVFKLADFGLSVHLYGEYAKPSLEGTTAFMSPERTLHQPYKEMADIWSLGCMLYELSQLAKPFMGNSIQLLYLKIQAGVFTPLTSNYSEDLQLMIRSMIQVKPGQRPSAADILGVIHQRRLVDVSVNQVDTREQFEAQENSEKRG